MIAHALTGLRLLLVVPTAIGFARPDLLPPAWLLGCILLAIASDMLDGVAARRMGTASPSGQLFDHGTDCLYVTAALAAAAYVGLLTPLLPLLVAVAFGQYVLDSHFLHRDKVLRSSFIGRWNGIAYFVPLVILAVARLEVPDTLAQTLFGAAAVLAWILVITTLVSIADRALAGRRTG
ncbi:MAG: CDP-alcohol phosphatidyltransferase family protein [Gammaproteobacteria bacterium]|nr:CDP-alcohol phosphatidyltransferase family protein [Gammaproteobacteria bacterium]